MTITLKRVAMSAAFLWLAGIALPDEAEVSTREE